MITMLKEILSRIKEYQFLRDDQYMAKIQEQASLNKKLEAVLSDMYDIFYMTPCDMLLSPHDDYKRARRAFHFTAICCETSIEAANKYKSLFKRGRLLLKGIRLAYGTVIYLKESNFWWAPKRCISNLQSKMDNLLSKEGLADVKNTYILP